MDRKIRVGAVSYLNTKPLIFGFEKGMMQNEIDLIIDYPSNIAAALLNDEIDIGLVPVAIIPELKEYHIISDYCIASDGEVASVCIFSEVPLQEIKTVLLDYQSRTSVKLAQLLLKDFWKINPVFINATHDFRNEIKGTTAAVVIGDRALEQAKISAYQYDLGLAWKQFTGLPFVFAAWVSRYPMTPEFIDDFNSTNNFGLEQIDHIVELNPYPIFDLKKYYTGHISYELTEEKKTGLKEFLKKLSHDVQLKP